MTAPHPVNHQPGFVLHSHAYKETSLVAELFTRDYGRVAAVARGARRPLSGLRGLIQPFHPLLLSWYGRGELRTLHAAEWQGGLAPLSGRALIAGFYLNELVLKLLARDDPHEGLYALYDQTLQSLAAGPGALEPLLRRFELGLLKEIGYAATLDRLAVSGEPVSAAACYRYQPGHGVVPEDAGAGIAVSGRTLLDLAAGEFAAPATLGEGKHLMRALIQHHLGGKALYTRLLLQELAEL